MRKSIIVGLLCLALFAAAYVGGVIAAVSQTGFEATNTTTKFTSPNTVGIDPCGDEGGGERPYSPPRV